MEINCNDHGRCVEHLSHVSGKVRKVVIGLMDVGCPTEYNLSSTNCVLLIECYESFETITLRQHAILNGQYQESVIAVIANIKSQ